jgi:hypothetical protein
MKTQEQFETQDVHAYPQSNVHAYPHQSKLRTCVAVDNGNRFIKWVDPQNEVQMIPSCIKEVSQTQWQRIKPDSQTVLIEIEEEGIKKRYVIGKQAQELDGDPVFQRNKCELAEITALVAIEPNPGLDHVHVARLAIALPSDTNESDVEALRRLENYPNVGEFKRNGKHICYTIGRVEPLNETEPAFLYAKQQGMFAFPNNPNAVWDIGGGTSIARIYLPSGTMVQEAEIILPGTKELAQQVATEMQAVLGLTYSPALPDIMDAIARGDCLYGTAKLDFSAIYQDVCTKWVDSARAEIRSKWAKYLPNLGEVLIVGGSANLAAPICQASGDTFWIAPEPQLFNIIAMAHISGGFNG